MWCEIPLLSGLSVSLRNHTTDFSRSSSLARFKRLLMCRQPLSKRSTGCLPRRHVREEEQPLFAFCSHHKEDTPKRLDTNHRRCEPSPTISSPGPTVLLLLCVATAMGQNMLDVWRMCEHPAPAPQEICVLGSVVRLQNEEPGVLDPLKK